MSSTAKANIIITLAAVITMTAAIILYSTGIIDKVALAFIGTTVAAVIPVYVSIRKINAETQTTTPVTPAQTLAAPVAPVAPVVPVVHVHINNTDNHTEIHYHTYDIDRVNTTVGA